MIIVGIAGPIGHGKSSFADALADLEPSSVHFEAGMIVAEVAQEMHNSIHQPPDPYSVESLNNWLHTLPEILMDVVHVKCSFTDIELKQREIESHPVEYQKLILHVENLQRDPSILKKKITQENKELFRPFLQWLGGYLVQKVDPGIWYNEIIRRLKQADIAGAKICVIGGVRYPTDAAILRSVGAIIVNIYRPGHLQSDSFDPTERERNSVHADCMVKSTGNIDDLKKFAKVFLADLYSGELKKIYTTT
jgi:hypothetical protein